MKEVIKKVYRRFTRILNRIRLHNRDFSIITNTCIGGVISHELGEQFRSPLVNCWMIDKDFYKFAIHLREYLDLPLRFVRGIDDTPTAWCGDILIHFNHYSSDEEANAKWLQRTARINWNNLFFITSDQPFIEEGIDIFPDEIRALTKITGCKGVAVFSPRKWDDDIMPYIIPYRKDERGDFSATYMNDHTRIGTWCWEHVFDYVSWLNTGKVKLK